MISRLLQVAERRTSPLNRWRLRYLRASVGMLRSFRPATKTCPICGYSGPMDPFGQPIRPDARCPRCGSNERHRLMKLWFDRNAERLRGRSVLHFAPEQAVKALIAPIAGRYVSADLNSPRADIVLNIEAIDQPDSAFEVVICSHVLEHVDDRRALPELFRILAPGGLALLMFPVQHGWSRTYENADIRTPEQRRLHFGRPDHVRYYGADARARIEAAGFRVTEFVAVEPDVHKYGLARGDRIYVSEKA